MNMRNLKFLLFALVCFMWLPSKADEGMWLLQMMQEQNLIDKMKSKGLLLNSDDIYNSKSVSLKDAVGIFGRGCTGEIISPNGLILTNHHCGYSSIQQHSSVEHDYLTNGFWAKSYNEELVTPGLQFKFVDKIIDITDSVNYDIKKGIVKEIDTYGDDYLLKLASRQFNNSQYKDKPGMSAKVLPFYAGNKFYLFFMKTYSDVRMVAAPPSSIGKFGGETDNWMWPRHTGDFSIFRIYADKDGNPAKYSKDNVPLKVKKFFTISLKGITEGDYAMILGFPGSTKRYLTKSEVEQMMKCINEPRIRIRGARLDVLKKEMAASDKVRIQYSDKYAGSSNYWKNSIGMNKALIDNKVLEKKQEQEKRFSKFAKKTKNKDYQNVIKEINKKVAKANPILHDAYSFREIFMSAIEFKTPYTILDSLKRAIIEKNKDKIKKYSDELTKVYKEIHNKDYDHEVDRKVAKALIPIYADLVKKENLLPLYEVIKTKYKGDYNAYVDDLYNTSIFANDNNFNKFIKKPTVKAIDNDMMKEYVAEKYAMNNKLHNELNKANGDIELLHKTYVKGLCEMYSPTPKSPDANFTIRLTYGNVKPYSPKDGVNYSYYTTLKGVMEKENPNNPEFTVPAKLKELYNNKDYGQYAMKNGEMPTCFLTTNDITGGNSGSPVLNGKGQLIGCAFDGNWESLSGDINFDDTLQRCIAVDIRYVLFIIDKLGGCSNLINEMVIEK